MLRQNKHGKAKGSACFCVCLHWDGLGTGDKLQRVITTGSVWFCLGVE